MKLRNQFEFLFVGKEEGGFLENYAYDLGEGEESAGQLFVTVEIQNNPADAEVIAETIFDSARKIFFSDLEKDPYDRFEDALKEVNKAVNQFKEDTVSKFIGNLHVIIGVTVDNELHLSQTGDAEAYLVRKRFSSVVSEGLYDPNADGAETFSNIASGTLESGDFIVLSTTRLLRYISKSDFIQIMRSQDLNNSLSDLKDALSSEILTKIGIVGMVFHDGLSELSDTERKGVREYLEDEKPAHARRERTKPGRVKEVLSGFGEKGVGLLNRLLKGMTSRQMTRDKILVLLIIVIVALTAVIWYVKNSGATQREIERLDEILVQVQEDIGAAQTRGISNKDAASQILGNAEVQAVEVLNSGYHRTKANELLGKIQQEKTKLDNIVYITNATIKADLSQQRENVSALGMIPYKDHVFVYEYNALYEVLLDTVLEPITIDDNENVIGGTYDDDSDALLFLTEAGKVIQFANSQFQFMDTDDGQFHTSVAMDSYNGRMYLLDNQDKQIWKYSKKRDSYDIAEAYIAESDLKDPVDIAIDGYVYVLESDGTLVKFDRGSRVAGFEIAKKPLDPIENPTKLYTELDLDQIFILEPDKNRVIELYKEPQTGGVTYSTQYKFDNLNNLRDLFYDKVSNRLYVMDMQYIYEIEI